MNTFHLYKDIQARTGGEIYIGVVGPVRTGKSTFIKRFMDLLVLPNLEDEHVKLRTRDELPQSASGKAIMTTEPKFVPKEAAEVRLRGDAKVKVRLIDCVGYMVEGALGYEEGGAERLVKTPWFSEEIPFTKAAEVGTKKVICDHATIGIVVTTDGTIGELPRENYIAAEEQTVRELQTIGKPFLILLNTQKPYGEQAKELAAALREKYGTAVIPVNCVNLKEEDIHQIMEEILFAFPISEVRFYIPKWVEMVSREHPMKRELMERVREALAGLTLLRDAETPLSFEKSEYIEEMKIGDVSMDTGCVDVQVRIGESHYFRMLSDLAGTPIQGEYELVATMKEMASMKTEYEQVKDALQSVRMKGYGVVCPAKKEIRLDDPVIVKQGNKYGVKIHSEAPTIHLIRANVETEIAPIVGNEKQAEDLLSYIKDMSVGEEGIWNTNIFGKSVEDLVMEGMRNKMAMMNDESQAKLQDTMQKVVNDSNGGMVCIII